MALPERGLTRWLPYGLLLAVLIAALAIGASSGGPRSLDERTLSVAATLKCPECTDKSMAASDAPTSIAGRAEIRRQLQAGRSPAEIRSWFEDRYGATMLLTPKRSGVEGLIWVIPVVAVVLAAAALTALFVRWRRDTTDEVTDDDRARVARALSEDPTDS